MTALSPDLSAPPGKSRPPERRDPAWRGRLAGAVVALLLLWPMLVLTEFKPWLLLAPDALKPSLRFLADFVPPRLDAEFLALVARETWRTVAIATAGLTLALVLAVPLALLSVGCCPSRRSPAPWRRCRHWCGLWCAGCWWCCAACPS